MKYRIGAAVAFAMVACLATSAPAATATQKVKLISPGASPRKVLRYRLTPQTRTLTVNSTGTAGNSDANMKALPGTIMSIELKISGRKRYKVAYRVLSRTSTAKGREGRRQKRAAKMLVGAKGVTWMSKRGRFGKFKTKGIENLGELEQGRVRTAESLIERAVVPLPRQAVGVGARWRVRFKHDSGEFSAINTIDYELVAVDGDSIKVRRTFKSIAKPQYSHRPRVFLKYIGKKKGRRRYKRIEKKPDPKDKTRLHLDYGKSTGTGDHTVHLGRFGSDAKVASKGKQKFSLAGKHPFKYTRQTSFQQSFRCK